MIIKEKHSVSGVPSCPSKDIWRAVWRLNVPPRWRLCKGILPIEFNIAKQISSFKMTFSICNHPEETDIHALLECSMAVLILEGSMVDNSVWVPRFRSMEDCFVCTMKLLDDDQLGIFTAILWEVWNARNHFPFWTRRQVLEHSQSKSHLFCA